MKILVVEDDRKVAGFIEQGLREEGYAVDVAPDGDEATTLAHVYDYEVVVVDVRQGRRLVAIGCDIHRIPLFAQPLLDEAGDLPIVFHDKDFHGSENKWRARN